MCSTEPLVLSEKKKGLELVSFAMAAAKAMVRICSPRPTSQPSQCASLFSSVGLQGADSACRETISANGNRKSRLEQRWSECGGAGLGGVCHSMPCQQPRLECQFPRMRLVRHVAFLASFLPGPGRYKGKMKTDAILSGVMFLKEVKKEKIISKR